MPTGPARSAPLPLAGRTPPLDPPAQVPRPAVYAWGTVGEHATLRKINTRDPVDMERYWVTNQSVEKGLMVDDIETPEELEENARENGRALGFTFAISARTGPEAGEFQGFVQFTEDGEEGLKGKIESTGLFAFARDVHLWEISYARYPHAGPHQVSSAVRQGCLFLLRKLGCKGYYPRVAILGSVGPDENPDSMKVLAAACFEPIASLSDAPLGLIRYTDNAPALDSVWLLNWSALHSKLRHKAIPHLEAHFHSA